jgi:hypothetical protein
VKCARSYGQRSGGGTKWRSSDGRQFRQRGGGGRKGASGVVSGRFGFVGSGRETGVLQDRYDGERERGEL